MKPLAIASSLFKRYNTFTNKLTEQVRHWPGYYYLGILLLVYSAAFIINWVPYNWNPSVLFRFGHYYVEQNQDLTPPGAIRFLGNESHGGNGYDGQIFYYFAKSLFESGKWPQGFSMAYRAPRIALPLLAAPFGLAGHWALVWGFYFIHLGLLVLSTLALLKITGWHHRPLVLLYIFSPFIYRSTMLMVSDGTAIALAVIGLYFWRKSSRKTIQLILAWMCFSLAILAKESALFLLFPLGLEALWHRRFKHIFVMLAALLPMILWQFYLRSVYGMVPANILEIFIAPFNGILGLFHEAWQTVDSPQSLLVKLKMLAKMMARFILLVILVSGIWAALRGSLRQAWAYRLAALFTALSIIFADHFYFWGIFDNIARMFSMLLVAGILIRSRTQGSQAWQIFFGSCLLLFALVFIRDSIPQKGASWDVYQGYQGLPPTEIRLDPVGPASLK